jgi:hypothetical protein
MKSKSPTEDLVLHDLTYGAAFTIPVVMADGQVRFYGEVSRITAESPIKRGFYWNSLKDGLLDHTPHATGFQQKSMDIRGVTQLANGDLLLTGAGYDAKYDWDIYQQRMDQNGKLLEKPSLVNTLRKDEQEAPDVTPLAGGGWITSWSGSRGQYAWEKQGFQLFDSAGHALGDQQQIASVYSLAFAEGNDGATTVASVHRDGQGVSRLNVQTFDGAGNPVTAEISGARLDCQNAYDGSIVALKGGGWAVMSFAPLDDENRYTTVTQQVFSADGQAFSEQRTVTAYRYTLDRDITALADGGFVVVTAIGDAFVNIHCQRYDANGDPVGHEKLVNSITQGEHAAVRVEALLDGGWVIGWSADDLHYRPDGAYFKTYDKHGHAVDIATAPRGLDGSILVAAGGEHRFALSDFRFDDYDFDSLKQVVITEFSHDGKLLLHGETVHAGDIVKANELDELAWQAPQHLSDGDKPYLKFSVVDTGGKASLGNNIDASPNKITFNVQAATYGGSKNDNLAATAKAHMVYGLGGDDAITGTDSSDYLYGGDDKDLIDGGGGNDVVDAGHGNDMIKLGDGDDMLVFRRGDGHDTVTGINTHRGHLEVIDLTDFTDIPNFQWLEQNNHFHDGFRDTTIRLGGDDAITILQSPHLTEKNFIFYTEIG